MLHILGYTKRNRPVHFYSMGACFMTVWVRVVVSCGNRKLTNHQPPDALCPFQFYINLN